MRHLCLTRHLMNRIALTALTFVLITLNTHGIKAPKYIFYFIGDGMGLKPVQMAQAYNHTVLANSEPLLMLQFPAIGYATTFSANQPITDSAAAGTALATGHKTNNGMLGMTPDSTHLTSIAVQLKQRGYGIAIATSVAPDDATPGAFYAHVPHRSQFYPITQHMAQSGFEFFAGGRLRGGSPTGKQDARSLLCESGYTIIDGPTEWEQKKTAEKIVLLNDPRHDNDDIAFVVDSVPYSLTLPFITRACIEHMQRVTPHKFFVMIEGGTIDHAMHNKRPEAGIQEVISFDHALRYAYDFYLKHKDETLIVVTADHNTDGWHTGKHSAEFAPVMAIGVGSELFQGFQDNTDIPRKIRYIAKIEDK